MRLRRGLAAAALFGATAALALAADVVVLKGGTVIPLKQPAVRRGNTLYITRADGTLLSVPTSEIDRDATAAANVAAAAPARDAAATSSSTAAGAARTKDGPKARVRITDADVSHPLDLDAGAPQDKDKDKKDQQPQGTARIEVADYTQEKKDGALVVKGSVRNPGQGPAENVRMSVTAFDEKGQPIEGANVTFAKGTVESGSSVEFNASLNVGEKSVSSLRFQPQWTVPRPPPTPGPRPGTPAAAAGSVPRASTP